jgi:MFS family permease
LTAILVFTVGEMLLLPIAYTLASTRASSSTRGAYLGAFGIAFSLAFIIGPPLGSLVYTSLGGDLLWYSCLPIAGIAALTFWRLRPVSWDTSS